MEMTIVNLKSILVTVSSENLTNSQKEKPMAYGDKLSPHDHRVKVSPTKEYRMVSTWIDTDNECWEEPYHLYGSSPEINQSQTKG